MKITIEIKDYDPPQHGIQLIWEPGSRIQCQYDSNRSLVIKANELGLISLARHLLTLAQKGVPSGRHLHLDESNALEDGSCEIILVKSDLL